MGAFGSLGIPPGLLHAAIMAGQSFTVTAVPPIPEFKCSFVIDKNLAHQRLELTGTVFAKKASCFGKSTGRCGATAEIWLCLFEYGKQVSE